MRLVGKTRVPEAAFSRGWRRQRGLNGYQATSLAERSNEQTGYEATSLGEARNEPNRYEAILLRGTSTEENRD
jgi:hypothetical protein